MKKSLFIPLLALSIILGSFVNFYAFNLLCSDIANSFMQFNLEVQIIATFPALFISIDFVLITLFLMKYVNKAEPVRRLCKKYLIILGSFSLLGVITSILTGTIVYHSFVGDFIFPCYPLIGLIAHSLLLVGSCVLFFLVHKYLPKGDQAYRPSFKQVISTIGHAIFMYYVFNRFGVVLWAPTFIQWRTFGITWIFYLWMLLPIATLILSIIGEMRWYIKKRRYNIISHSVIFAVNIGLGIAFYLMELNNTALGAAISPAMPISRLASMPAEALIGFILVLVWSATKVIKAIFSKEK